jgi:hypothetical protein
MPTILQNLVAIGSAEEASSEKTTYLRLEQFQRWQKIGPMGASFPGAPLVLRVHRIRERRSYDDTYGKTKNTANAIDGYTLCGSLIDFTARGAADRGTIELCHGSATPGAFQRNREGSKR